MMPNCSWPQPLLAFEVAIICALCEEYDAVEAVLDETYDTDTYSKGDDDPNRYTCGKFGRSNVVLSLLPGMGKEHAASGSAYFRTSFPDIKLCLVVGICAGSARDSQNKHILLGDIIVSTEIVQSDFGRQWENDMSRKKTTIDNFGRPSKEIRGLLAKLQTWKTGELLRANTVSVLTNLIQTREVWHYSGRENEILFRAEYHHKHHLDAECEVCDRDEACETAQKASCEGLRCDPLEAIDREVNREDEFPLIHFGAFSSTNQVIRSSKHRDARSAADGVIGFEMEGAGVWDNFPTVIIKGVCDYADSHKNKKFQGYAAAAAASCSKAFLIEWEQGRRPRDGPASASWSPSTAPVINNNYAGGTFTSNKAFYGGNFTSNGPMNF
jgi:nucleoside phosphorylase